MQRFPDIESQVTYVASEEPLLGPQQLDLIRQIICLRRRIDVDEHFMRFQSLLSDGGENLMYSLSTRWLVSIADTFADHGSELERANAMIVVVLANVTKLAETERLILKDPGIDPELQEKFTAPGTPLWDGMTGYALRHGDMPNNMWTRIRAVMAETPALSFIFETVLARMMASDTLIGRLAALNSNFATL